MAAIIVGVIVFLLLISMILIYNKLVKNRNRMQEAWSIIDVYLKKRHDLIPAIVDTVKAYSLHEQKTLEELTRYRTEALKAPNIDSKISTESMLTHKIENLLVVVEKYPDLKANQNFLNLQMQLSAIENDLEKARRYYNGTVRENNIALESFPSNVVGNMFDFSKGIFFQADASEKVSPEISFK